MTACVAPLPVLVVDDDADASSSYRILLEVWGHRARTASDGPGAVAAATALHPRAVLIDLDRPHFDGCDLARHLRASAAAGTAVLIGLTADDPDERAAATRSAGLTHVLVKPVDPDELRALLAAVPRSP
jgi:two-component system, OmpR family, response regulator